MNKRARKHLEMALGGNMNIATLKPLALIEIMTDFAKKEVEAINYTHSCKSDSEQLTKRKRECECSGMSYKVKCGFKCHK